MTDATNRINDLLKRALEANTRYYEGIFQLSTEYVRGLGDILTSSVGIRRESEARATRATTAVVLEAESGEEAHGYFVVENKLSRRVSAKVVASPLVDPNGREASTSVHCAPEVVALGPGEQAIVQVSVAIDPRLDSGVAYRGSVSVPGLSDAATVVVRRRHSVEVRTGGEATVADPDEPRAGSTKTRGKARRAQTKKKKQPAKKS